MTEKKNLSEVLLDPTRSQEVIDACVALIEAEVASKRGLTGMGIKAGFAAVKKFKPGIIAQLITTLLPEFIGALEPFYQEFLKTGGGDIAVFVNAQKAKCAEGLLNITDTRALKSKHKVLVGTYNKLRPLAMTQVSGAMPKVGTLLKTFGL